MKNKFYPVCEPLLAGNELKYVTEAVSTGWISSAGKYVQEFEKKFSEYCGMKYGVAVCNGTVALHLALVSLGVGPGDEVIIPDFTMIASAFAVCYTGAKPVFVDADLLTWNIDVNKIEDKINSKTKAIMPVHIFGLPCAMDKIQELAKKYNLYIIEDAAESHGSEYQGKKSGSFSAIASFSFFANKNLTTGEGGMVVTNDEALYNKARYFKNVCFPPDAPRDYRHEDIGFNYRMSNLHAAIGLAQTEKADYYRDLRIKNGLVYRELLSDVPGISFQKYDANKYLNVFWMNAVLINAKEYGCTRDELIILLKDNGVETRKFFNGMHRQNSLSKYGADCTGQYMVSDTLADNGLYLPSGSNLERKDIEIICNLLKGFRKN